MTHIPTGPRRTAPAFSPPSPARTPPNQAPSNSEPQRDVGPSAQPSAALKTRAHTGPKASDLESTAAEPSAEAAFGAIEAATDNEQVRYGSHQVSLKDLKHEAFARNLPFLVLAHLPKYGPPTNIRPCSLWCSDEETEHSSHNRPDWRSTTQKYQSSTLFVMQPTQPHIINMGILADLQNPAQPKRTATCLLQLNEPQSWQEPGRDWHLRAMTSMYLAAEHPSSCAALSQQLAEAIPQAQHASVYTDALLSAIDDRDVKIALQCVQRGADLAMPTEAGTTPLIEATLRAPIMLLRRLLKAGIRPEHGPDLAEALEIAVNHGLRDRIVLLQEHMAGLSA